MFLKITDRGHTYVRGPFLLVFGKDGVLDLRVLVRSVTLRQSGQFMVGSLNIRSTAARAENDTVPEYLRWRYPDFHKVLNGHYRVSLSGTYGHDGLPISSEEYPGLWDQLHPVPEELVNAFWKGGGHNTGGTEMPLLRAWALGQPTRFLSKLRRT